MSLLLGALSGAGKAVEQIADQRIANIDAQALATMKEQVDIAKERRVEEARIREEQRGEAATIRGEDRTLTNADLARKSQFEFEYDPANVKRRADAEVSKLEAQDAYRYANQGKEAAYQRSLAEARYAPMREARGSGRSVSTKIPEADKMMIKSWQAEAKALRGAAATETDEVKQLELLDRAKRLDNAAMSKMLQYSPSGELSGVSNATSGEQGPTTTPDDVLGIRGQFTKEPEKPEPKSWWFTSVFDDADAPEAQAAPKGILAGSKTTPKPDAQTAWDRVLGKASQNAEQAGTRQWEASMARQKKGLLRMESEPTKLTPANDEEAVREAIKEIAASRKQSPLGVLLNADAAIKKWEERTGRKLTIGAQELRGSTQPFVYVKRRELAINRAIDHPTWSDEKKAEVIDKLLKGADIDSIDWGL